MYDDISDNASYSDDSQTVTPEDRVEDHLDNLRSDPIITTLRQVRTDCQSVLYSMRVDSFTTTVVLKLSKLSCLQLVLHVSLL